MEEERNVNKEISIVNASSVILGKECKGYGVKGCRK